MGWLYLTDKRTFRTLGGGVWPGLVVCSPNIVPFVEATVANCILCETPVPFMTGIIAPHRQVNRSECKFTVDINAVFYYYSINLLNNGIKNNTHVRNRSM